MNLRRTAPRLMIVLHLALAAILVQVAYWTLWRGQELANHQRNPRYWTRVRSAERGRVLAADGVVLAESVRLDSAAARNAKADDEPEDIPALLRPRLYKRRYPQGAVGAHVVGYSDWRRGEAGVERALSGFLAPPAAIGPPRDVWDLLAPPRRRGDDVVLTIDWQLQRLATDVLGKRAGAVAVVEVATGAVKALVDYPTFDPQTVDDTKAWQKLATDEADKPLLALAYAGRSSPGSTFKVLTAAATLDAGTATPETTYLCQGTLPLGYTTIKCDNLAGHGRITLHRAIAVSCNIALARAGIELGPVGWQRAVEACGLNARPRLFRPGSGTELTPPSTAPANGALSRAQLAECSFGQGALNVTPLWVASMAQAIGNGGIWHDPFLVQRIVSSDPTRNYAHGTEAGTPVVSQLAAQQVLAMMRDVFRPGGTASGLADGLGYAGKTGSAQNPHGRAHSWFIALGPGDRPRYAVAVVVRNAGWGRTTAGPIAVRMLTAALNPS